MQQMAQGSVSQSVRCYDVIMELKWLLVTGYDSRSPIFKPVEDQANASICSWLALNNKDTRTSVQ
jgi:hypothetical protein